MKKAVLSSVLIAICILALAQAPGSFSYQVIVRDGTSNNPLANQSVSFKMIILKGSTSGLEVYTEYHSATTSGLGLVTLAIGNGTGQVGSISSIDWGVDSYFLKVMIDKTGGTTYVEMGTTQLLSVPYALYSKKAGTATETDPLFGAWNKSSGIGITASQVSDFQSSVTNNDAVLANTAKNSYPNADAAKLAAITGTNTGDETITTIKDKLGITTLSGGNTGDQTLSSVLTQGTDAGNKKIINVNQQGIGTATPDASSALEISSTTQGFLPPRMTKAQRNEITPVEGLVIYNTTTKILNYFDGTVWRKFDGSPAILDIGESYEGGIIAYVFQPYDPGYVEGEIHGLIATPSDQSTEAEWGCSGTIMTGADGSALGTGYQNTIHIVNGCSTTGIAARICYDLELNGYPGWYLPSKDELNKLFINKTAIGGFVEFSSYWSSTEKDKYSVFTQNFYDGEQSYFPKEGFGGSGVRAVRSF